MGSDPILLWLWRRPAPEALIQSLAWELPALKKKKKKKKSKKKQKKKTTKSKSLKHETETAKKKDKLKFFK